MLDHDEALLALVRKYDRPGPRYTSYPTALAFTPEVGAEEYVSALGRLPHDARLSLYVHVPFCDERCHYCGCHVIPTRRHEVAGPYVSALREEMALLARTLGRAPRLESCHLGGGTPTYLAVDELRALFEAIGEAFVLDGATETAVEIDPRVTTDEHLISLRALGASRVSLGVQDTSPEVQEAIGRHQSRDETVRTFERCRDLGFRGVNIDLVYGLPRQTPERFERTLEDIVSMRPDRLAVYGYAHVPWMRPNQRAIDATSLPEADERLRLHLLAHARLTAAGYRHIGMDHFALETDELSVSQREGRLGRSFMGYTPFRGTRVLGIGVSSIGDLGSGYFQNEKKLAPYSRRLARGELPIERGCVCEPDDVVRRHVIHEVLCNLRVTADDVEERFGIRFDEHFAVELDGIPDLERDGLVEIERDDGRFHLRVTERGRLFLRNIAMVFDRALRSPPTGARYSRTV